MFTKSTKELGEPGKRGQTREHANKGNSGHLGARQVTAEWCNQGPMWYTLCNLVHAYGAPGTDAYARQCHRAKTKGGEMLSDYFALRIVVRIF